ncbi:DUF930 domain-containing protein [Cohaesibacter celericrescens]|uniref:DUF930 domain-containing protein n=1 Tax=Cohaesibacter celericrescens TaxID=2067669 RepID=A0A2N5XUJ0_9HYPH|nr:DUF930 domain-containing protein [Cohaesibacter celericrescens]PLW78186.1 hypothetical protein C0081_05965 [Cohaesibacter celericrescens]
MKKQITLFVSRAFLALIVLMAIGHAGTAHALDKRTLNALKQMVPEEQLIQRCELEAMDKLNAARIVAYTFEPLEYGDTKLKAPGAAYRKKGDWYRVSYSCTTSEDRMEVVQFSLKKGDKIPKQDWEQYNLFP